MLTSECRHHPTQKSVSMLLGFLSGEICHSLKVKSCDFVMLRGNYWLSTFVREGRKELEHAPWSSTRRFSLSIPCIRGEIAVLWQFSEMSVHLGICLYVMSDLDSPCHTFSKKRELHEGHACELLQFKLPSTRKLTHVFFIAVALMDYLLLTYVKRLFQKEAIFFLDV